MRGTVPLTRRLRACPLPANAGRGQVPCGFLQSTLHNLIRSTQINALDKRDNTFSTKGQTIALTPPEKLLLEELLDLVSPKVAGNSDPG